MIYAAPTEEAALSKLDAFTEKWDEKYPMISKSWRTRWTDLVPYLQYLPEIRKVMYTTNAIKSMNYSIRQVTKTGCHFHLRSLQLSLYLWHFRISRKMDYAYKGLEPGFELPGYKI